MTKEQLSKIIKALIVFVIAVVGALGYDVAVIQPRMEQMARQEASRPGPVPAATAVLGQTYEALNVTKNLRSFGTASLAQASITSATITSATITSLITSTDGLAVGADGLTVVGATALNGGLTMDTTKFSVADTSGNTTIAGTLTVTGAQTLVGNTTADGTLTVTGATALNGGLTMDTTKFSVADTSGNTTIAGTLTVTGAQTLVGATTANGTLAVTGAATFSGFDIYSSASITPTDGGTLTPTAMLVTLTPPGALGTALGSCTSGQKVILYNSVSANVVITDTGNGVLAGNQTLGQYDALPLACFGATWVQVGPVSAN